MTEKSKPTPAEDVPNSDFADFVDRHECAYPQMPLMHTTDLYRFRRILRASKLSPTRCKVFDSEILLYLFYGRPAYRPHSKLEPSSIHAYRPVCLVLEPDAVEIPARIFPFDTGAFARGLYDQHLHEDMAVLDFQLKPIPESAMKAVNGFFGSNKNYFLGTPKSDPSIPNFQFEAHSFSNLITEKGKTLYDDRRATIEIQIKHELSLSKSNILAVCMPTPFADDEDVSRSILTKWKADIITYPSYHASISEDVGRVFDLVLKYLEDFRYV